MERLFFIPTNISLEDAFVVIYVLVFLVAIVRRYYLWAGCTSRLITKPI